MQPSGQSAHVTESPRLVELIDPYQRYLIGEKRRDEGVKRYVWGLRRFLAYLGDSATLNDMTFTAVQSYKEYLANDRDASTSTIINALAIIRDFAQFAAVKGYPVYDPTLGVKRPPRRRPNPKPLYPEEIAALLDAIHPPDDLSPRRFWHWQRNRRVVYLLLYSGLRLAEAAGLLWKDVHLSANIISVRTEIAKGGRERVISLHPRLKAILEEVPRGERYGAVVGRTDHGNLSTRGIAKVFSKWVQRELQHPEVHAHRLRHSFACLMLWHGADLKTIQELLGHAQLGTTEWYLTAKTEHKVQAVNTIPDFG